VHSAIPIFIAVVAVATTPARAQSTVLKAIEPKLQPLYDCLDAKQKKASDTGGRIGGIFDWLGRR